jgi:hypothetical protein
MPPDFARASRALAVVLLATAGSVSTAAAQDSNSVRAVAPVEIHGFIQVYYRSGDPVNKDGYRLRKADLKFSGDISPRLRWRVGFDAAKAITLSATQTEIRDTAALSSVSVDQRTRILQDAALTYKVNPALSLDVGQQIIPLSLEGTIPTSNIETIERTEFIVERSRAIGLGDIREVGISANGQTQDGIEYHVGLFNETGEAAGTTDPNDEKTVMARVAWQPAAFKGLQIGGSGGFQGGANPQHRERAATEVQYRTEKVTLRGETMSARDGALKRFGWYGLGVYRPTHEWQLAARWDLWDRDLSGESSISNALEHHIVLGASYLFDGAAKVAVNVVRQTFPNISSVRDATFALVAFQAIW